jgi:lactoylglutathione lyase
MSRIQLALNVDDLDEAVAFYATLFNTAPAKLKDGYANFAIADPPLKLVLFENPGQGGTINHLGVEVGSSDNPCTLEIARLTRGGAVHRRARSRRHCCFATQDKVTCGSPDPAGERWGGLTPCSPDSVTTIGSSPAAPRGSRSRRVFAGISAWRERTRNDDEDHTAGVRACLTC